eukprot:CAMPEP_0174228976 /NCGR_PEP_ID=MMETSP0417-20130205/58_1 /TAXON_ID=242541 /ORGANISM="Mayorella sp, Strain BSH-02190019" /LENGTH=3668 /DNA_ID=CAMNT_0015306471 /DNA_START=321 /DNA_END=11327 /DNA_ORIENTATION=-
MLTKLQLLSVLVLLLTIYCGGSFAQRIHSVSTSVSVPSSEVAAQIAEGSALGGVRLYLRGQGFSENQYSAGNTVYVGLQECPIITYLTSDTVIVCEVPAPAQDLDSPLEVQLIVDQARLATCAAANDCLFQYSTAATPQLDSLSISSVRPAQTVLLRGDLRATEVSGVRVLLAEQSGASPSSPLPRLAPDTEYLDTNEDALANLPSSLPCVVGADVPAGHYHLTVAPLQHGSASIHPAALTASVDGLSSFALEVYPTVAAFPQSAQQGSLQGGHVISVSGSGFGRDLAALQLLSGEGTALEAQWTVRSVLPTLLVAESPAQAAEHAAYVDDSSPFQLGGHGVRAQLWTEATLFEGAPASSELLAQLRQPTLLADPAHGQRLSALLRAPATSTYTFAVLHAGQVRLSLGTAARSRAPLTELLSSASPTSAHWYEAQLADAVDLVQGEYYYLEVDNWGASGDAEQDVPLAVAVRVASAQVAVDSLPEVQQVSFAAEARYDTQLVTLANYQAGDHFALQLNGHTTEPLAVEATAAQVRQALEALQGVQEVSVQRQDAAGPTATFTVEFRRPYDPERTLLAVDQTQLSAGATATAQYGQVAAAPLSGVFALALGGAQSQPVSVDASDRELAQVFSAGLNLNCTVVVTDRGIFSRTLLVTLYAPPNAVAAPAWPLLQPVTQGPTFSTGGGVQPPGAGVDAPPQPAVAAPTLRLATATADRFIAPVHGQYLRTAEQLPQLSVRVNGVLAACDAASCEYVASAARTPTANGASLAGADLTITGAANALALAGSDAQQYTASVAGQPCAVTGVDAATDEIRCTLSTLVAGTHVPQLHVAGYGAALIAPHSVSVAQTLTGSSPPSGSVAGGTVLTLLGSGFSPSASQVRLQDAATGPLCEVLAAESSDTELRCVTPPSPLSEVALSVHVSTNGAVNQLAAAFTYAAASTPQLDAVQPLLGSTLFSTELLLSGSGFGAAVANNQVYVGAHQCSVTAANSTHLSCTVAGSQQPEAAAEVRLLVEGSGQAQGDHQFEFALRVDSVSPALGSVAGGTLLSVRGAGFPPAAAQDDIAGIRQTLVTLSVAGLRSLVCAVESVSETEILCRTPAMPASSPQYADQLRVTVLLRAEEAQCASEEACAFRYSADATPQVTDAQPRALEPGAQLRVDGSQLGAQPADHSVLIGGQPCEVTSVAADHLLCTAPDLPAGDYELLVSVAGSGLAALRPALSYALLVTQVSPSQGSRGGADLLLQGRGFAAGAQVQFGGHACADVQVLSSSQLSCTLAPLPVEALNTPLAASLAQGELEHQCDVDSLAQCGFEAVLEPSIAAISPLSDATDSVLLTATGSGLGDQPVSLWLGGVLVEGVLPAGGGTQLQATFEGVPAGEHQLRVLLPGVGYALWEAPSLFAQALTPVPLSGPPQGSFAGGSLLEVSGSGFGSDASLVSVSVCGSECAVSAVGGGLLSCVTPPLVNEQSAAAFGLSDPLDSALLFAAQPYQSAAASPENEGAAAFDGDYESAFASDEADCYVGLDLGADHLARLSELHFFPRSDLDAQGDAAGRHAMVGGWFEGTAEQDPLTAAWSTLYSVDSLPDPGWTRVQLNASDPPEVRFVRYRGADASRCQVAELRFVGERLAQVSGDPAACEVLLTVNGQQASAGDFEYASASTPLLTGLSPRTGSTLGGTELTLTFAEDLGGAAVRVLVDGVECTGAVAVGSQVTCQTGARPQLVAEPSVEVRVGAAEDRAAVSSLLEAPLFLYVDRWSEAATWVSGRLPVAGDSVLVPAGQHILLDVSPPPLQLVVIEGSLSFEDASDLKFEAGSMFVNAGGRLAVGSEAAPFTHRAEIVLTGDDSQAEIPIYGTKNIAVRSGTLDLHGLPVQHTWSRLASSAAAGATSLAVQGDLSDWAAGAQVVVASSTYSMEEAEVRTLSAAPSYDGPSDSSTLLFDEPLQYAHHGETETHGGLELNLRAEVGLLSRNVVVRGDDSSAAAQFGGQIMLHSEGDDSSVGRLSYVEARDMGQAFKLGRYPVHFHMIGAVHQSYVRGCAIHRTYNRAVTIHGVRHLRVERNVVYDNMGHAYFIEDGAETDNVLDGNLGLVTRESFSLLNTDATPATFWITNPNNIFRNNAAAGSDKYGYWYDLPTHPGGPSATELICPQGERFGQFDDNSAHSNGRYGLRLHDVYVPREDPCGSSDHLLNPSLPADFNRFTSYRNQRAGVITTIMGALRFNSFAVADCMEAGVEVSEVLAAEGEARLVDSVIVSRSQIQPEAVRQGSVGFFAPRSEGYAVRGLHLVNFDDAERGDHAFSSCAGCWHGAATDNGVRRTTFELVTYDSVANLVDFGTPFKALFRDLDGSLSGETGGATITPYWPHLAESDSCRLGPGSAAIPPSAPLPADQDEDACPHGGCELPDTYLLCDADVEVRRLAFYDQEPAYWLDYRDLVVRQLPVDESVNASRVMWKKKKDPERGWAAPFVSGHLYQVFWDTWSDFKEVTLRANHMAGDGSDAFMVQFNYTDVREWFRVRVDGVELDESESELTLADAHGAHYHNRTAETLTVLVRDNRAVQIEGRRCARWGNCLAGEPCDPDTPLEAPLLWSEASTWPELGAVPQDGDDVVIPCGRHVLLDEDSAALGRLFVSGRLSFSEASADHDLLLQADTIVLRGGTLDAGSEASPYPADRTATVQLNGQRADPVLALTEYTDAGNKALVNLGVLSLHGSALATHSTQLAATASAGSKQLLLVDAVPDWPLGAQLLVTTTSFSYEHAEVHTLVARSADSRTLTLQASLAHQHYGAAGSPYTPDAAQPGLQAELRAEVALLSRNVVVQGSPTTSLEAHGCHVLTARLPDGNWTHQGAAALTHVEVRNCGQWETDHVALHFEGVHGEASRLSGSALHSSWNAALLVRDSGAGVAVLDSVVHQTIGSAVRVVQSQAVQLQRVLVSGVGPVRVTNEDQTDVIAAFELCVYGEAGGCAQLEVSECAAVGSADFGFAYRGEVCGADRLVHHNRARATQIGLFLLRQGEDADSACTAAGHFSAVKAQQFGAFFYQASDVQLDNLALVDCVGGLEVNPCREGQDNRATVSQSAVVGVSPQHSLCGLSDALTGCDSAAGVDCDQRVGVLATSFITAEKSLPPSKSSLPWDKIKSDAAFGGVAHLDRVHFANFPSSGGCSAASAAFRTNARSPDAFPTHRFSRISLSGVPRSRYLRFDPPNPAWRDDSDCQGVDCTGLFNALLKDLDQSFFGGYALANNPGLADTAACQQEVAWNGISCAAPADLDDRSVPRFATLTFESLDRDTLTRRINPVTVWADAVVDEADGPPRDAYLNTLTAFQDHHWDFQYTSMLRLSRFPPVVQTNRHYNVDLAGTVPTSMRFQLQYPDTDDEVVLLTLTFDRPEQVLVMLNDSTAPLPQTLTAQPPTTADQLATLSSGQNFYSLATNQLSLALRGGADVVRFETQQAVHISLHILLDLDLFFSQIGETEFIFRLAALLEIPSSSIQIAEVSEGSTIVKATVLPAPATPPSDRTSYLSGVAQNFQGKLLANDFVDAGGDVDDWLLVVSGDVTEVYEPLGGSTNFEVSPPVPGPSPPSSTPSPSGPPGATPSPGGPSPSPAPGGGSPSPSPGSGGSGSGSGSGVGGNNPPGPIVPITTGVSDPGQDGGQASAASSPLAAVSSLLGALLLSLVVILTSQ